MARRKMESPEKPTTKRTFMEELPVKLAADLLISRSDALQKLNAEQTVLEAKFEKIRADHKEKIGVMEHDRKKLNETLANHAELQMVECEETVDFERNRVTVRRLDTGEQVSERAMEAGERNELAQTELPIPGDDFNGSDEAHP